MASTCIVSDETPGGRRFREGTSPYEVGPKDLADCRKIRQFRAVRSSEDVLHKSFQNLCLRLFFRHFSRMAHRMLLVEALNSYPQREHGHHPGNDTRRT